MSESEIKKILVAGIPLYKLGFLEAVNEIITFARSSKETANYCISATGAHGIVFAQRNKNFKELLNNFFLNLPDGMPGVWVGGAKGAKKMERCYGPDFFAEVIRESANKKINHFLCGGMEGVAEKLKTACEQKFGNQNIVGTLCPPFKKIDEYDYQEIAKKINTSKTDIVWIGISTPKQEQFAMRLSEYTNVKFLITVGAAFDFHIGNVKQAPKWMQQSGLEWFFRLMVEPKRLWKRYFEIVPLFTYYGIKDLIEFKFKKK